MPPPYCYDYPRPSVTVDLVVFALVGESIRILLVRRGEEPFAGSWAIPGGFLDLDESPSDAAIREVREETGLAGVDEIAPIGFYAAVDRDPRGRVISLAHAAVVKAPLPELAAGSDAREAAWLEPSEIESIAFDHGEILKQAFRWLLFQVQDGPLGLLLLPDPFSLADIKRLFVATGGSPQAASGWRRRMEAAGRMVPAKGKRGRYRAVTPDVEPEA